MMKPLPLNAGEIFVEWRKGECGLGITAFTDETGRPFIGLYPLNWDGTAIGAPVYFQRSRLMADIMVGFVWNKPAVIFVDAEVTARGLDVRFSIPLMFVAAGECPRHLWAHWGNSPPQFQVFPANNNWLVAPKPRGKKHDK